MTLLHRFEALFSPRRRWIDGTPGPAAGGFLGPRQVILPRAASMYRRFDFSMVPPAQRRAALDVAVRQDASGAPVRPACRWQGAVAHAWIPTAALPDPAARWVAESSLLAPPPGDAHRLVALRDGVEGQVWRGGVLAASRWWSAPPDAAAWALFLRGAGVAVPTAPPPVEPGALSAAPWGDAHERVAWSDAQLEAAATRAGVFLLALLAGWLLATVVTWTVALTLQSRQLDAIRTESTPLISARERAEAAQQRVAALAALAGGPSDLALLRDVHARLPDGARLVGWTRDGQRLRIDLAGAGSDPRPIVQAFADHAQLGGVVANPVDAARMQLDVDLPTAPEALP